MKACMVVAMIASKHVPSLCPSSSLITASLQLPHLIYSSLLLPLHMHLAFFSASSEPTSPDVPPSAQTQLVLPSASTFTITVTSSSSSLTFTHTTTSHSLARTRMLRKLLTTHIHITQVRSTPARAHAAAAAAASHARKLGISGVRTSLGRPSSLQRLAVEQLARPHDLLRSHDPAVPVPPLLFAGRISTTSPTAVAVISSAQ